MEEPPTVPLILGWGGCAITGMLVGMTLPMVLILAPSLVGIMGWQMAYEYKSDRA